MEENEFQKAVTNVGTTDTFEKRKVQTQGRVDIPDEWWEDMGLNIGESVFVTYDEDEEEVKVFEADPEMLRK